MSPSFNYGTPVVVVDNLGYRSPYGFEKFYYNGTIEDCPLGISGIITGINEKSILVKFENRSQWNFHVDEIDFKDSYMSAICDIPKIFSLDTHPLLQIAKNIPTFIIDNKVYVTNTTEDVLEDTSDYFQTRAWIGYLKKKVPLHLLDSINSLDELFLIRTARFQKELFTDYEKRVLEKIKGLVQKPKDTDLSLRIYSEILPHLSATPSEENLEVLLNGNNRKKEKTYPEEKIKDINKQEIETKNTLDKSQTTSDIKSIASQIEKRISFMKKRLENKKEKTIKKTKQDEELDELLGYIKKEEQEKTYNCSPLKEAIQNKNIAFIDDQIYNLYADEKKEKKGIIEISGKKYFISKETIELESLERTILVSISKQIRLQVLQEKYSNDQIAKLIKKDDAKEILISGKKEYKENESGFLQYNDSYYAFLEVPAFVLKSQFDKKYYFFDKTRVAISIDEKKGNLTSGNGFYMIENNNHPFLHLKQQSFASICIGDQTFPTTAKTRGELVGLRLRRVKEVLLYGYTSDAYRECYELRTKCRYCGRDHFKKNRIQEDKIPKDILVIQGGKRK